jgi:branched-chain amino acid transport system substrate-binding protein
LPAAAHLHSRVLQEAVQPLQAQRLPRIAAPSPEGGDGKTIKIGVYGPVTGGSAVYGEGAQNAIAMAVEEINYGDSGYKVEIVNGGKIVDDGGDAKQAINAYNSLMKEGPSAIVGSFFSSVTLPVAEQASKDNMLLLATGATNKDVTLKGSSIFRNCFIDPYQGKMAAQFAKEKGWTKAAVIYAKDDDYSNGLKDAFIENAEANGIEVVYVGECTTKDTDFSSQTSQVVAKGADFLFYPAFLDTVPLLVGAARDAGFDGAVMGGDGWDGTDTAGFEDNFENCYFTNHYSSEDTAPAVVNFVSKYTEKYGTESLNACAALYYDAIYMLMEAAKNSGASDTVSLVNGMTGMTFTGVGGTFTMDENGDPEKSVAINTFEGGKGEMAYDSFTGRNKRIAA